MIVHQTWRSMFYKLSEHYPDCLMLNFTIKVNFESYFSTRMNVMTDLGFVMPCRTIIIAVFDTRCVGRETKKRAPVDNLFFTLFLPQTHGHNKWLIISHQIAKLLRKNSVEVRNRNVFVKSSSGNLPWFLSGGLFFFLIMNNSLSKIYQVVRMVGFCTFCWMQIKIDQPRCY